MSEKIPVTVLGATGVVGQRFVRRLARHPLFRVHRLAASERSAGRRYREACAWRLPGEPWAGLGDLEVVEATVAGALAPVVFSALDAATAQEVEPAFARAGAALFSNAAAFRMAANVPLLVPEANPEALALLALQRRERGWTGAIVCNPNCTAAILATVLAPLHRQFGVEAALVTTMQAASGAGLPGVPSLDLLGNVLPHIRGEEEKIVEEIGKLLGRVDAARETLLPAGFPLSAACHRVPVVDGHTEALALRLAGDPPLEAVRAALERFTGEPQRLGLPSAPARPILVHDAPDRPQPRLDVETDGGMTVHVGRLRSCAVLGVKMTILGNNVERGAAGASVLNAELALATGWISGNA